MTMPSRNCLADVAGLRIGQAGDARIGSGVTVVIFDEPCVASVAVGGGAPGLRDAALLEPGMSVERVDALVLSGGSAFGLDAPGGVQAVLRRQGRGFAVGEARVPIVPGAILFDLGNGGDKAWGCEPVYWHLGRAAAEAAVAGQAVVLGSVGAGLGATTATAKGGLGSASAATLGGFIVGALVAVNALGSATVGDTPHFWAAPFERRWTSGGEFGGLGWPSRWPDDALDLRVKGSQPPGNTPLNTTVAVVATDARLSRVEAKRVAVMAQDGLARALRPCHAAMDGDTVFAAATARVARQPEVGDVLAIGSLAADCLARAIARAVYEATALPFPGALPSWRDRFAGQAGRGSGGA